ncbi:MAG: hypothetical protein ABIA77_03825 [Candidatus Omnitrophota bacterium]
MNHCFAAFDAGCKDMSIVVARWKKDGDYAVEDLYRTASKGFRKGTVVDVAMATDSVASALGKLRKKNGKNFHEVYAGISAASINTVISSGTLLLSKYGKSISEKDVRECVRLGSIAKVPLDREILHSFVLGFSIDDEKEICNPVDLEGVKLGVKMSSLTVNSSAVQNMAKCIAGAGFVPAGFVFSGLASSFRVLNDDDREKGALLLNIYQDQTEALIFHKGILNSCKVFRAGTDDILTDGAGFYADIRGKLMLLPGWENVALAVVTGDGTLEDNLIESLETSLSIPVKAGTCIARPFEDLPADRAGYIGSLGILDHLKKEKMRERPGGNMLKRGVNSVLGFLDKYF